MKQYRTLRGFLEGKESIGRNEHYFDATLRIHGNNIPFSKIIGILGVKPSHTHEKGKRAGSKSPCYNDDAIHFSSNIPSGKPLRSHIEALWDILKPHRKYIKSLKKQFKVDIYCGYRSNCDQSGLELPYSCLEMFTALEVPFGLSIIVY